MTTTITSRPVDAEVIPDSDYVKVTFAYSPDRVARIKKVPSAYFVGREKGGPFWRLKCDLMTMRKLREQFGNELSLGENLKEWGRHEVNRERNLSELSQADDAELENVPAKFAKGCKVGGRRFTLRPYQRADIKFMSQGMAINANQPGAGKTIETIGAIFESNLEWGQHLVFAPVTSLRNVWQDQIKQAYACAGYDEPVVLTGDTPDERREAIAEARRMKDEGLAFWLVLNPHMARLTRVRKGEGDAVKFDEELKNPELIEIDWDSITIDEFHLMGLSNPTTMGAKGVNYIAEVTQPSLRYALSGTPMGGKPIKLWGALHFLNPGEFTSRWHWARHWLIINHNGYGSQIEGIMPGREVDFYNHLKPYLVRRTKKEALPGLPPKQHIEVWCSMSDKQSEQYRTFEQDAEWRLSDAEEQGRLTATNILAEYMRLKQFSGAFCEVHKTGREVNGIDQLEVIPTEDSGKLAQLDQKLAEEGVFDTDEPKVALVFSQFNGMVEMVANYLQGKGVPIGIVSGKVTGRKRNALVKATQAQSMEPLHELTEREQSHPAIKPLIDANEPPRVLVMNTEAGGASLNLSVADSVHILDETWVPDNQEQAEDRAHRGDEITMAKDEVRMYYYRTKGTIEHYIQKLVAGKQLNNKTILDLRRRMQRDAEIAEREAAR